MRDHGQGSESLDVFTGQDPETGSLERVLEHLHLQISVGGVT